MVKTYGQYLAKASPWVAAAIASRMASTMYAARRFARPKMGPYKSVTLPSMAPLRRKRPAVKRRPKVKKPSSKRTIQSRLKELERQHKNMSSLLICKRDTKATLRPGAGEALYGYQGACLTSEIESSLANCRFFDPSTPGTLITANLSTPTYTQKIQVSVHSQLIIRNNYQTPCIITFGVFRPRVDTSTSPITAIQNGLADAGNPDSGSTLISFRDSKEFFELYSGKLRAKRVLPGRQVVLKTGVKQFEYDPSFTDTESETYTIRNNSTLYVYRVQGVLGHDTAVSTEQGIVPCGVDIYVNNTYYIRYNSGGASIKTIVLTEGASQTFTNGAVVSSMPVSDNIGYSVS